jgi:hypothetical protein
MEYLATYGWAIAIITVILALLFSLHIFNSGSSLGTSCTARPGYACTGITMSQTGLLSFTFSQAVSAMAYNAQFACISSTGSLAPILAAYTAQAQTGGSIGTTSVSGPTGFQSANIANLGSLTVTNVQCYTSTGGSSFPIGTPYVGQIWMVYNTNSVQPFPGVIFVQVAAFSAKSSS